MAGKNALRTIEANILASGFGIFVGILTSGQAVLDAHQLKNPPLLSLEGYHGTINEDVPSW